MGQLLRDRLKRLKGIGAGQQKPLPKNGDSGACCSPELSSFPAEFSHEWELVGYKTLRRKTLSEGNPVRFSPALAITVPDIFYCIGSLRRRPAPEDFYSKDLLFFDLETTGLSGGAGTVAFLAAFGRFEKTSLEITQYLLLDFPGEAVFIDALLQEFKRRDTLPVVVSYNGKTFDSQILKTRCLMNGFSPPEYYHADLLHPCRRLWKRVLPDCSQGTIETGILGLDRTGDVPGALAPDIWFSFLRTGAAGDLMGICDHNLKDIRGLARIFFALGEIAASPQESRKKYNCDTEALALRWREALRRYPGFFGETEVRTGNALLKAAAKENHFRALKTLAIEAEWKECDFPRALDYSERILALEKIPPGLEEETVRRRERLLRKISYIRK